MVFTRKGEIHLLSAFQGIYPALLTPFDKMGKVNKPVLKELVERNIQKGVAGFYVCGSTSEAFFLSAKERKEILETVAEQVNGRCTLIAHIGHIDTDTAIDLAKHAEAVGVNAISSVSPFYYNFTFDEIKRYYFEVADSVSLSVIIYNFPAFSKVNLTEETISAFFDDERFVGLKHTSNDFFLLERLKKKYPNKDYFNGYDEMFLPGLAAGATGAIGSTFNVMAEKFIRIMKLFLENKVTEAQAEQQSANNIISALCKVGVMAGEKAILRMQGLDFGEARRPFGTLSDEQFTFLKGACKDIL